MIEEPDAAAAPPPVPQTEDDLDQAEEDFEKLLRESGAEWYYNIVLFFSVLLKKYLLYTI